ncbi:MAG: FAD-dependent thymidylate synthase [Gammaproteobacteria bacterium]
MKIELVDYTGCGAEEPSDHAACLLIFAKNTRLEMKAGSLAEIKSWSSRKKLEELERIANTTPESWEHIKYSFLVTGVTRAFSHQFVRSRTFSFSPQTMRVLNVKGWEYATGPTIEANDQLKQQYDFAMRCVAETYDSLIAEGAWPGCGRPKAAIEDARGILPTNILMNIMATGDLRTVVELVRKRSSPRAQGEYREVLDGMKECMIGVHPWVELFIDRTFDRAAQELDTEIGTLPDADQRARMIKLVDQLRKGE